MTISVFELYSNFDRAVDKVRALSKNFCQPLGITTFGYVRVYDHGKMSWVTTNPEQDRFLVEAGMLNKHPLVDTKNALKEGCHLDSIANFPGCEAFYQERAKRFQIDHSMVVVRHNKNYLETCCFSGLSTKRSLYPFFMNEQALFRTFMEYFTSQLDRHLMQILSEAIILSDVKAEYGKPPVNAFQGDWTQVVASCGWEHLYRLSRREKQCLQLLKKGYTYQAIGLSLGLSARTVEHYLDSVKNKLGAETRSELYLVAEKLVELHIS